MAQIPAFDPENIPPPLPALPLAAPQIPRLSAAAVTSLICGIVGCIPVITGVIAIVTGIIGLRATRNPMVTGRGLAIAGLILGIVGLAGWGAFGGSVWIFSAPERALAHRFIIDLAQGDSTAAGECSGNVSPAQLIAAARQVQTWGGVKGMTILNINVATNNGVTTGSVAGHIATPAGTHQFSFRTVDQNGTWLIDSFTIQ